MIPLLFVGVVVLILLSQVFWVGAVQPGGVVLCIILFNTPVDTYVSYSLNRMLDTGIGVIMSLLINWLLPRERLLVWLAPIRRWYYRLCRRMGLAVPEENQTCF